jgi:hypothetical protein
VIPRLSCRELPKMEAMKLTALVLLLGTGVALADPPEPRQVLSLREEATRVATELVGTESRTDPQVAMWRIGRFTATGRAAHLEGGAAAAVFVGEMILALGGSKVAAAGALAAAATLDAAAGEIEAEHQPKPKRVKHTLY